MRKYYEAYDDRYRQVHGRQLRWFAETPSPIVAQFMEARGIGPEDRILEIGCGEGRDAAFLLDRGYRVLATDISPAAIDFCRGAYPAHGANFRVLDCLSQGLEERFPFIYAVAVVHMLVEDGDRDGFYGFLREHLTEKGVALVCSMGDGQEQWQSDIRRAFETGERTHEATGARICVAGTSCRVVSMDTFQKEIGRNGLKILEMGRTSVKPDFPEMIYAVVQKE